MTRSISIFEPVQSYRHVGRSVSEYQMLLEYLRFLNQLAKKNSQKLDELHQVLQK